MDGTTFPAILAVTWLLCEALKTTKLDNKWLPLIACGVGATLGALCALFVPELVMDGSLAFAVTGGGLSGLAATGANEAITQLLHKEGRG